MELEQVQDTVVVLVLGMAVVLAAEQVWSQTERETVNSIGNNNGATYTG